MKNFAAGQALRMGLSVGRKVTDQEVRRVLSRLQPVETEISLIRVGAKGDGGYLVPDDLAGISACFSPGVDVTASFEMDLQDRGITSFLADASVEGLPPGAHDLDFEKKFVGSWSDDVFITMDDWMAAKLGEDARDLLLQMDIEGAEWTALLNISEERLKSFRIMVIEFHCLPQCFDQIGAAVFESCLGRLAQHFHVVHAHPNNIHGSVGHGGIEIPHYLEVTYLRKDRADAAGYVSTFPHPLDAPCAPELPDPPLQAIFRNSGAAS